MGEMKPDIIEDVTRYDLWLIPQMPMNAPLVRPRQKGVRWRTRLLDDIRENGLRYPILVYGHSPKGRFNMARWGEWNKDKKYDMYIAFGTNRYFCLQEIGAETFPAILSWNKGTKPPFEGEMIAPEQFRDYAPEGRIYVQDHAFGYTVKETPEDEFGT